MHSILSSACGEEASPDVNTHRGPMNAIFFLMHGKNIRPGEQQDDVGISMLRIAEGKVNGWGRARGRNRSYVSQHSGAVSG